MVTTQNLDSNLKQYFKSIIKFKLYNFILVYKLQTLFKQIL